METAFKARPAGSPALCAPQARLFVAAIALFLASCGGGGDSAAPEVYPHANEPIGTVRQIYDGALPPDLAVNTFRNIDRLFASRTIAHGGTPHPLPKATNQLTQVQLTVGTGDSQQTYDLIDYLTLNRVAGLLVIKNGEVVLETYQFGNTEKTRWMSMSVAKSITSTLIGAAIKDGHITSIDDPVTKYVPQLAGSGYDGVSVRNVLMMASGVRWDEAYTDPTSDRRALLEAQISQRPGAALDVMRALPRAAPPGTVFNYSTGETQVAAEIVRGATKRPLAQYLSEKIWARFGMEADARWWLDSPDGVEIGGSGISATLRDYARFGLFFLNGGVAGGEQVLPVGWTTEASTGQRLADGNFPAWPPTGYGYMWWPGWPDGSSDPANADKAFLAAGIFGQAVYINAAQKIVIAKWGAEPKPFPAVPINDWDFFEAVVKALK